MRVAVLGTGTMGAPMARHLAAAGHEVRAWNRTREKAEGLGAEVADLPAAAVEDAEVVITMLADGPAVDAVLHEALPTWGDAAWLQMSTVGIAWTRRLAAAGERGVPLCRRSRARHAQAGRGRHAGCPPVGSARSRRPLRAHPRRLLESHRPRRRRAGLGQPHSSSS